MNPQVQIRFRPQGIKVSVPSDLTVLEAARESGVVIDSICGGKGRCGKCLVKDLSGKAEEPTEREKEFLSSQQIREGFRLACQTRVREDQKIQVVQETVAQGLRGKEIGGVVLDGVKSRITQKYVELLPPSAKDQVSDRERITRTVPEIKQISLETLKKLPGVLRETDFKLTLTLFEDEILTIKAGNSNSKSYGLAIDLGTTTVAVYLVDLESRQITASGASLNRQSSLGADVISRISAAQEHPEGLDRLQKSAV
ncbi:MAG: 2Fe-2S iron-sulfur cluster-binding protein, partial [Thermodesulfobacteriota bacterium]